MRLIIGSPAARCLKLGWAVAGVVLLLPAVAAACPTCKEALVHSDPHHQSLVAGYFYSILLMMSTPFVVAGSFAGYAYWLIRRDRLARAHAASAPDSGKPS